ncbi:Uncharacterized protein DAT39_011677, partial [Clarias magur]
EGSGCRNSVSFRLWLLMKQNVNTGNKEQTEQEQRNKSLPDKRHKTAENFSNDTNHGLQTRKAVISKERNSNINVPNTKRQEEVRPDVPAVMHH